MDGSYSWDDETHQLHAMINLLSLRNGGQMDESLQLHPEDSDDNILEYEDEILSEAGL